MTQLISFNGGRKRGQKSPQQDFEWRLSCALGIERYLGNIIARIMKVGLFEENPRIVQAANRLRDYRALHREELEGYVAEGLISADKADQLDFRFLEQGQEGEL